MTMFVVNLFSQKESIPIEAVEGSLVAATQLEMGTHYLRSRISSHLRRHNGLDSNQQMLLARLRRPNMV